MSAAMNLNAELPSCVRFQHTVKTTHDSNASRNESPSLVLQTQMIPFTSGRTSSVLCNIPFHFSASLYRCLQVWVSQLRTYRDTLFTGMTRVPLKCISG